ncbi:protein TolQ [Casimicrobium huifangae]|uniref:protein TolQ n=1 Tax=Casimicrobium huifangae TaxID=2591109 RepID=UPI0037851BE9
MKPTADLSFIHLITGASVPVQAVMLLLVLLSLWSWWLIFYKGGVLKRAAKRNASFDDSFWQGSDLNQLYARIAEGREKFGPQADVFAAGFREFIKQKRQATASKEAVVDGTRRALKAATQREMDGLEHQLPGLATVASVSPYIGLLGTVWGIMNSFRGLASVGQATLAQVAPGIAEALIATAIGLFAAIPAVVAYNRFQAQLDRINTQLETFAEEFLNILQRQA